MGSLQSNPLSDDIRDASSTTDILDSSSHGYLAKKVQRDYDSPALPEYRLCEM